MIKVVDYAKRVRHLRGLLFLEVFTLPIVVAIFKFIESRMMAGLVAGALFIVVGLILVYTNYIWIGFKKSPVFWLSCVHLFLIAIPIYVFRNLNLEVPFEEVLIFGIPGPIVHKISEKVFSVLMLVTLGELMYTRYQVSKSQLISNKTT